MSSVEAIHYAAPDWEPGLPLFTRAGHGHSLYFFNFRDGPSLDERTCTCNDAAAWPTAKQGKTLSEKDDIHLWDGFRRAS